MEWLVRERSGELRVYFDRYMLRGMLILFLGMYAHSGRSKASVVINLKHSDGKKVFFELVARADVLIHNFRPGVSERLGIDYEACNAVNPNIVYLSFTGFGRDGPLSSMRVYDPVVQAMSGICSLHIGEGQEELVPQALMDKLSGLEISQAVLSALCARREGYGGQMVTVSMLNVGIYSIWPFVRTGMFTEKPVSSSQTRDGLTTDLFGHSNCDEVRNLADEEALLDDAFKSREVKVHTSAFGAYRAAVFPAEFASSQLRPREGSAMVGEHTNLVLHNLGYTRKQRSELVDSGALVSLPTLLRSKGLGFSAMAFGFIEHFQHSPMLTCKGEHRSCQGVAEDEKQRTRGPLEGLNVLELAYGVAGPVAGKSLCDRGACVTKVELENDLDPSRKLGEYGEELFGSMFAALNSGKQCRTLSLCSQASSSADEEELRQLIEWADILILDSNVLKKLQCTFFSSIDRLSTATTIVALIEREMNEVQLQGLTGMAYTPLADSPQPSRIPIVEVATGNYTAAAVLAAQASSDNKGETIHVSMTSCAYHFVMPDIHANFSWLHPRGRPRPKRPDMRCVFQLVPLRDGNKVFTHCLSDKEWKVMRKVLVEPHVKGSPWEDKLDNWGSLVARLGHINDMFDCIRHCAKNYTYEEYLVLAQKHEMMCGRVNHIEDVKSHEQVVQQNILHSVRHPSLGEYLLVRQPAVYTKTPTVLQSHAQLPNEGQHNISSMLRRG